MLKILFPLNTGQRYYKIHYQYVLDIFKYDECDILFNKIDPINDTAFICFINDKEVVFDFSDSGQSIAASMHHCFKFHYRQEHKIINNFYPFVPVSFYYKDWDEIDNLGIVYTCNSNKILFNQRSYGNAIERRDMVRTKLIDAHGDSVDTFITDQLTYWNKINNCLCAVFVPGFCNNMIDRAQLQFMRLGCCTISPKLPEILPGIGQLIPWLHYIQCADDYSDLLYAAEFVKSNRDKARFIGRHAKEFLETKIHPKYLVEWIKKNITR